MRNKIIAILLLAGMSFACNSTKKAASNTSENNLSDASSAAAHKSADGKSYETAVVIMDKNETAGIKSEYQWIRDHYSNYKVVRQSLRNKNKKPYDVITIEFGDGTQQEIFFDISKFYGHY